MPFALTPDLRNDDLTLEMIPNPSAKLQVIFDFALSFDAYAIWGSFERCADIANAKRHETLTDLRVCLFFEQRRYQHFGEPPSPEEEDYIRKLVSEIAHKAAAGLLA